MIKFKSKKSNTIFRSILFVFALFSSCSPNCNEEIKKESQKTVFQLIKELNSISSREDLIKKKIILKKYFDKLAVLMIEADKLAGSTNKDDDDFSSFSDELKSEMIRIYEIDGGQELIENYQKNALRMLTEKNVTQ